MKTPYKKFIYWLYVFAKDLNRLILLQFLLNQNRNDYNEATFLPQTSDYPSELEAEKPHNKNKTSQHFIKKNIEVSIKA